MTSIKKIGNEHVAIAKSLNLSISTKHSIEISRAIRYRSTSVAKTMLENVINMKKAIPFRRFNNDVGHKPGIAAGRYPQKAAKEFLKLVKSVEANAQSKGLNAANLKITKIVPNKASIPFTGGRQRTATKRTNLEIEVKEVSGGKKKVKSAAKKVSDTKEEVKIETTKTEEVKEETKKEIKAEVVAEKNNDIQESTNNEEELQAEEENKQ